MNRLYDYIAKQIHGERVILEQEKVLIALDAAKLDKPSPTKMAPQLETKDHGVSEARMRRLDRLRVSNA